MVEIEIQKLINTINNLDRIKTAIEVIRELDMYKNIHPDSYNDEQGAAPSFYTMYKDVIGVERILLNKYGDDLGTVYWNVYKYITNTIQEFLFENIFDLRRLQKALHAIEVIQPTSLYSNVRWFGYDNSINYIESRVAILIGFDTMLDWMDGEITKKAFPTTRSAYDRNFLKSKVEE